MIKRTTNLHRAAQRFGGELQRDGSYTFGGPAAERVGGAYTATLRFCSAAERLGFVTRFGGRRAWIVRAQDAQEAQ